MSSVHIKAYVGACEVWELDRNAKAALMAVCGRMEYPDGVAEVPAARIAADMHVAVVTARRALVRVVEAGFLTVDNRAGQRSRYVATPALLARTPPARNGDEPYAPGAHPVAFRLSKGLAAPRRSPPKASGAAGDKPSPPIPRHPPSCACAGTGWLEVERGTVEPCPGKKGRHR